MFELIKFRIMSMPKKGQIILSILFFGGLITVAATAQPVKFLSSADVVDKSLPHLSDYQKKQVLSGGRIEHVAFKTWQFGLHPDTALKSSLARDIKELNPSIFLETLQFLPWPKNFYGQGKSIDILLRIYNTARSISTMEGISYYSASRQKMRTLFAESYTLDKPETGKKIPDTRVDTIPEYSELYLYQRDLSFGQNVSKGIYQYSNGVISLSFVNLTALYYGIIRAVNIKKMNLTLLIVPTQEGLLLYCSGAVRALLLPGLEKKIQASIRNRIIALADWFQTQLQRMVLSKTQMPTRINYEKK